MTARTAHPADHAALMDATYRHQRRIYDLTRRYYLLGRDTLIAELAPPPRARILEIACGTGRNLDLIGRRYPDATLYGLDISEEMLLSAAMRVGRRARLVCTDACRFGEATFGVGRFDRIVLSYALSMIPDWERALANAAEQLAPGGELHIVDFHDQAGLPPRFGHALRAWLAKFHVTPRTGLSDSLGRLARGAPLDVRHRSLCRGYAQYAVLTRRPGSPA
jgi:S-adenosylmethionine-diacylgycerolhomoserine-N-methlytransferase